ncbi:MAG TPA: hypothetical protein VN715_22340 [Roseiarcus sp.]|nr:hypothetical protein [Roseiarcus sp.]
MKPSGSSGVEKSCGSGFLTFKGMPLSPGRSFELRMPGGPSGHGSRFWSEAAAWCDGALCHQHLMMGHGIYLHEGLNLDALAATRRYEFAYVFSPLPIVGATGSPGTPLAVL